jgi:hypothetical protein
MKFANRLGSKLISRGPTREYLGGFHCASRPIVACDAGLGITIVIGLLAWRAKNDGVAEGPVVRNARQGYAWNGSHRHYYLGGCRPAEFNHAHISTPVSACRAFRNASSRVIPGANDFAFSLSRLASSTRRSSSDRICLKGRLSMIVAPSPPALPS